MSLWPAKAAASAWDAALRTFAALGAVAIALLLQAQAHLGLGRLKEAGALLRSVLRRDPNHALTADLRETLT